MLGEDQADQFAAPVGVLLTQRLGLLQQRGGDVRPRGRSVIGWRRRLSAVVASEAEQVVDRPHREMETLRQGVGSQTPLAGTEHGLTDGRWNGTWHGRRLRKKTCDTK